jgi:murein DD-endopeptidase MepM/ murein hydrolase activator NlpD
MKRPSIAAACAASLLFATTSTGVAGDWAWVERAHIEEAGRVAEERLLGREEPPVPAQMKAFVGLADHLRFMGFVSVDGLVSRTVSFGFDREQTVPQPLLVAIGPAVPPPVSEGPVGEEILAEGRVVAERLLGDGDEEARLKAYLPFERQRGISGVVVGRSFAASAVAAGVPAPAMLEVVQALGAIVDLDSDIRDGDRFHVRFEQEFTAEGAPLDVGRVLWVELRMAKATIAIHRYRSRDGGERFWQANGQAATPPSMRMPLETISISSGFGLRADPFDQPPPMYAGKPQGAGGPLRAKPLPPGLPTGGALDMPRGSTRVNTATPLGASLGLSSYGAPRTATNPGTPYVVTPKRGLFMHEGIDLVAPSGTPVLAAADGIVVGAAPNGRYGNWIRIDHGGKLTTVYGHLAGFAKGITPGTVVSRGDVIGFVGSTGRSTGAHLHFELLSDGKPVNPVTHPETRRTQLRTHELERFRKQITASLAERDREAKAVVSDVD